MQSIQDSIKHMGGYIDIEVIRDGKNGPEVISHQQIGRASCRERV